MLFNFQCMTMQTLTSAKVQASFEEVADIAKNGKPVAITCCELVAVQHLRILSNAKGVQLNPGESTVSTDDFAPRRFRPHGRVEFVKQENVLICYATGPFNFELMEALSNVQKPVIEELIKQGKWGDVVILKESALVSPETLNAFEAYLMRLAGLGLISSATAFVLTPEVEGAQLMAPYFVEAYSNAGVELHVCDSFEQGLDWVKAKLV